MIKRHLGIDFLDLLIQAGITIALAVMAATVAAPEEEIGVAAVFAASFGVLAWRRARAMKSASVAPSGDQGTERIAELEQRVAELEYGQSRLAELEERVDFSERLLVRQRDEARIARGGSER